MSAINPAESNQGQVVGINLDLGALRPSDGTVVPPTAPEMFAGDNVFELHEVIQSTSSESN